MSKGMNGLNNSALVHQVIRINDLKYFLLSHSNVMKVHASICFSKYLESLMINCSNSLAYKFRAIDI